MSAPVTASCQTSGSTVAVCARKKPSADQLASNIVGVYSVTRLGATLILSNTAQPMRGRVMGLRTGVVISLPLGNFLAGAAAERFGAPLAQGAYAAIAIVIMLGIVLLVPSVRKSE